MCVCALCVCMCVCAEASSLPSHVYVKKVYISVCGVEQVSQSHHAQREFGDYCGVGVVVTTLNMPTKGVSGGVPGVVPGEVPGEVPGVVPGEYLCLYFVHNKEFVQYSKEFVYSILQSVSQMVHVCTGSAVRDRIQTIIGKAVKEASCKAGLLEG